MKTRCFNVDAEEMPYSFFLIEDAFFVAYITVKAIIIAHVWVNAAHSNSSSRHRTNLIILQ